MDTPPGRSVFSVLLFQDLAVIPMLALLPLLATSVAHGGDHHGSSLFDIHALPGYLRIMVTLAAIGSIFMLGKFGSLPIFRAIAATRVRDIFVAAALALVVGISLLTWALTQLEISFPGSLKLHVLVNPDDQFGTSEYSPIEIIQPIIIAEMETRIPSLSVGEAVMQMELAGSPVLVFRNEGKGGLNVVYRRDDGNIGWIDPQDAR